jgi:hypothetical protein
VVLKDFLLSKAHNANTHLSSLNFTMMLNIIVELSKHPTLIMILTSRSLSYFFKFFFPLLSCRSFKRSHNPQVEATQKMEMMRIVFKTKKERKKPPTFPKDSHLP